VFIGFSGLKKYINIYKLKEKTPGEYIEPSGL